jgi:hypothetical protein
LNKLFTEILGPKSRKYGWAAHLPSELRTGESRNKPGMSFRIKRYQLQVAALLQIGIRGAGNRVQMDAECAELQVRVPQSVANVATIS